MVGVQQPIEDRRGEHLIAKQHTPSMTGRMEVVSMQPRWRLRKISWKNSYAAFVSSGR